MSEKYNPYEDPDIHIVHVNEEENSELVELLKSREGFNSVIKHGDAVNGFQMPKRLDQTPSRFRVFIRWAIILWVGSFLGWQVYSLLRSVGDSF